MILEFENNQNTHDENTHDENTHDENTHDEIWTESEVSILL